jgi:hypothetical protein
LRTVTLSSLEAESAARRFLATGGSHYDSRAQKYDVKGTQYSEYDDGGGAARSQGSDVARLSSVAGYDYDGADRLAQVV